MSPESGRAPLLEVRNLKAWYAESQALEGVDFHVNRGELVTLIGRNGAGKTTTLKSIMGIVQSRKGSVRFEGQELIGKRTYQIARLGIAYCPEERGIFAALSVRENLTLPPHLKAGGMSDEELLEAFPNLRARASSGGTSLSGGEQQMLAIARILRNGCQFLLLDEPSEGLAPVVVKEIGAQIRQGARLHHPAGRAEPELRPRHRGSPRGDRARPRRGPAHQRRPRGRHEPRQDIPGSLRCSTESRLSCSSGSF